MPNLRICMNLSTVNISGHSRLQLWHRPFLTLSPIRLIFGLLIVKLFNSLLAWTVLSLSHAWPTLTNLPTFCTGPFKCYVLVFFGKFDNPSHKADSIELYTYVTLFVCKFEAPPPHPSWSDKECSWTTVQLQNIADFRWDCRPYERSIWCGCSNDVGGDRCVPVPDS